MDFEEKVLTALNALTEKVEKIEVAQAEQGKQLAEQGKQLAELTGKVDSHSEMLKELTSKVSGLEKKIDLDVVPYVKMLDDDQSSVARRVTALERAK